MGFRLPEKCRDFFDQITDLNKRSAQDKLHLLFDQYYYCLLVGLYQAKIATNPNLEPDFLHEYPMEYRSSRNYIAGLLLASEVERLGIPANYAEAVEEMMVSLIDPQSKTFLTKDGVDLLNLYAARGFDVMAERMAGRHVVLEDFYQDYWECFQSGVFSG